MVEITLPIILQLIQTVALIVGIIYYLTIMRNSQRNQHIQIETRQAQLYTTLWNQSFNNPDWMRNYLIIDSLEWTSFEEYMELVPYSDPTSENTMAVWKVSMFFEALSPIIKKELIDLSFFFPTFYGLLRSYWLKLEPIIPEAREHISLRMWTESEYVYNTLTEHLMNNPSQFPHDP